MKSELFVLAVLCFNVFLAIYLERTTKLKHLGAALLSILITAVVANLGIIPSASNPAQVYQGIFTYVAPASIFMLLLGVNIRQLKDVGKTMLILFFIAMSATCLGVFIADMLLGDVFEEFKGPVAGMITGTYTGGSINFNAVALHYNMVEQGALFTSIVAVDNILTTIWMAITLILPTIFMKKSVTSDSNLKSDDLNNSFDNSSLSIYSISILIVATVGCMVLSDWLSELTSIPSILVLTSIALLLAQFKFFKELTESKVVGLYLIYLFMSVVGAFCEISAFSSAGQIAYTVFSYLTIVILIHAVVVMGTGLIFRQNWHMISIASQASVGGSSTALALAKSFKRDDLLLPAVLIGALGNAFGTYLGFLMAAWLGNGF